MFFVRLDSRIAFEFKAKIYFQVRQKELIEANVEPN